MEHVASLRAPQQLLEPRGIFEPQFERFAALGCVGESGFTVEPRALLRIVEEQAKTHCGDSAYTASTLHAS